MTANPGRDAGVTEKRAVSTMRLSQLGLLSRAHCAGARGSVSGSAKDHAANPDGRVRTPGGQALKGLLRDCAKAGVLTLQLRDTPTVCFPNTQEAGPD